MSPAVSLLRRSTIVLALSAAVVAAVAAGCANKAASPGAKEALHEEDRSEIIKAFSQQLRASSRTGVLAADREPTASRRWHPLFWNSWIVMDTEPASVEPARALEPDRAYKLHLDLAGIDYRAVLAKREPIATAVAPAQASDQVIALLSPTRASALIEIVVLPDERYFQRDPGDRWSRDMTIKPARVLAFDEKDITGSPFVHPDTDQASYRFGHVSFRLVTKAVAKPTTTSIGIAMWADHRPVQELELLVCLDPSGDVGAGRCPLPIFRGGAAGATVAAALGEENLAPDAALHLVRLSDTRLVSVFRRGSEPLESALKWRLAVADDGFVRSHISRLTQIFRAADPELPNLGSHFLQDLFEYATDDVAQTRQEFIRFFTDQFRGSPGKAHRRTVAFRAGMKDFIPLGLAAVKVDDKPIFLGERLSVDFAIPGATPHMARAFTGTVTLNGRPLVSDDGAASCELPWVSVLPPLMGQGAGADDRTLLTARARLSSHESSLLRLWERKGDCTFTDMIAFRDWANTPDAAPRRAGLFVLSHHDVAKDMLFFSPAQNDLMSSDDVTRPFAPGSIAILDACGTGNPAALGFIDALSKHGVQAIVATATEVKPEMASDFAYCLTHQFESRKKAIPLGDAFDEALTCLANTDKEGGGKYGARAYTYALLGDRTVPVCRPPAHQPSCKE